MPPWKGLDFEPRKQGISLFRVAGQAATCRKNPKKTRLPEDQNSTYSFSAYKTSGVVMRAKPPNTKKKRLQNCTKIPPFFHAEFFVGTAENSKKHYVLNGFAEKIVFLLLGRVPKNPYKDLMHTKSTLFLRTTNRARNPFKTSAKRSEGNPDTDGGPDSPLEAPFFGQDSPPTAYIYIYGWYLQV